AAVNGVAAGAGAVLALAADLRLVARSPGFAFLFTRVGPAGAGMGAADLLPPPRGPGEGARLLVPRGGERARGPAGGGAADRARDARRRRRGAPRGGHGAREEPR